MFIHTYTSCACSHAQKKNRTPLCLELDKITVIYNTERLNVDAPKQPMLGLRCG